uniref:eCIS core domain-containing protein n=1 Tax=Haloterrigena salifodinae TaxID=2675099 RepID=UPI0031B6796D
MEFRSMSEVTDDTARSSGGARDRRRLSSSSRSATPSRARSAGKRFGIDFYKDGLETNLQRLAYDHGPQQVREWADEGMPVDIMGKPWDMEDFRERQQDRPAAVPTDIERRNNKSVQRSRGAHNEPATAGDTQVPDSVRDVISSPGQQLDTSIQRAVEERMGDNLGDVRIHTGPKAATACEDINARAFTVGNHIAFNHGEYDPSSPEGQHVLVHELAHVRQQTGSAVSMLPQDGDLEIDPDPRLEREAEETADRVMRGGELGLFRMRKTEFHVQRLPGGELVNKAKGLLETGTEKIDESTTKRYRLTKDQLVDMVQSVETPTGLTEYIEHHDIDVASRVQDAASSTVKGATKGWTVGSMLGSVAGPVGAVAGGLSGVPLGAFLTTKFGEQTAGKIQKIVREVLDLKTDQEFDSEDRSGSDAMVGQSRRT